MRAVILNQPASSAETMVVTDVPAPVAGPGEALVKVAYGGLNYADTMMRRGVYPHPKGYPLVAGIELSGTVAAVGAGVSEVGVGDRVAGFSENAGAFAEYCALPAERLIPVPAQLGLDVAAAFHVQCLTAWHLLHTVSTTRPGDTLLVHAAGGGVGLYLTQLAVAAGATVIGTVGTAGKALRAVDYGAERVVDRNVEDFVAVALAMTGGRGVDKVVDSTGGSILDRSFDALKMRGWVVSYGEAEARPQANLWERLVKRSHTFTRLHIGHIDVRSPAWIEGAREVTDAVVAGRLKVPIEGVYLLDDVGQMFARLESRQVAGKLLLAVA